MMWDIIFLASALSILALPFLPAFLEWLKSDDAHALIGVESYDIHENTFTERFKVFTQRDLELAFVSSDYFIVGDSLDYIPSYSEQQNKTVTRHIIANNPLTIPSGLHYQRGIYGKSEIRVERGAVVYSLLSDESVHLEPEVEVLRWVHAEIVHAEARCSIHSKISATQRLELHPSVCFTIARAPMIVFNSDESSRYSELAQVALRSLVPTTSFSSELIDEAGRIFIDGNYVIPNDTFVNASLVIRGKLSIGNHCIIKGAIKSYGEITVGAGAQLHNSVTAVQNVNLAVNTFVSGPLIAEGDIMADIGCRIGRPENPTSVACRNFNAIDNVIVYGALSVSARDTQDTSAHLITSNTAA